MTNSNHRVHLKDYEINKLMGDPGVCVTWPYRGFIISLAIDGSNTGVFSVVFSGDAGFDFITNGTSIQSIVKAVQFVDDYVSKNGEPS